MNLKECEHIGKYPPKDGERTVPNRGVRSADTGHLLEGGLEIPDHMAEGLDFVFSEQGPYKVVHSA